MDLTWFPTDPPESVPPAGAPVLEPGAPDPVAGPPAGSRTMGCCCCCCCCSDPTAASLLAKLLRLGLDLNIVDYVYSSYDK